jgi:hypothetical protein
VRFVHGNETELFQNCIGRGDIRSLAFSVEQQREARMTDLSLTDEQRANWLTKSMTRSMTKKVWVFPDNDDDDDDCDDSDDDEAPAVLPRERWLSRPDFGSPEWWSRT